MRLSHITVCLVLPCPVCFCLSVCRAGCLSVCLCFAVSLSVCLPVWLSVCVCLFVCLNVSLSLCLALSMFALVALCVCAGLSPPLSLSFSFVFPLAQALGTCTSAYVARFRTLGPGSLLKRLLGRETTVLFPGLLAPLDPGSRPELEIVDLGGSCCTGLPAERPPDLSMAGSGQKPGRRCPGTWLVRQSVRGIPTSLTATALVGS